MTTAANLGSGVAAGGPQNWSTGSVTLQSGRLYLLTVVNTVGSGGPDAEVPSVSGWSQIGTVNYFNDSADANRLTLLRRAGDGSTAAQTIAFTTDQGEVYWSIEEAGTDTDASGTNGSAGIVQSAVNSGNSAAPSATLGTFGNANNGTFGAFGLTAGSNSVVGGAGFTELATVNEGAPFQITLMTQFRSDNDTSVDASTGGAAQWGVIAVELKSTDQGPPPADSQYMPSDIYL